ncbi:uncharacterized protein ACRADG_004793 [Cochliomyia hominivorax]
MSRKIVEIYGKTSASIEDPIVFGFTNKLPLQKHGKCKNSKDHNVVASIYERSSLKTLYDMVSIKQILTKSKRYKYFKPKFAFEILGDHRNFLYLKKIAISRLETNLKKQFNIIFKRIQCIDNKATPIDDLSHSIFSWKWNDFLLRRRLKNYVWVDVLLRIGDIILHTYKFKKDLEQLLFFVKKIFDGLFSNIGEENINIYQYIAIPVDEAIKVLRTINFVEDDLDINIREFKQLVHKEYFFINAKRDSEEKFLKAHLENRVWNSHIYDPIEVRFQLNRFHNNIKENQCCMDIIIEKYHTDINHLKQMLELEAFIYGNCMDYCYSSIEMYKNRINEIQEKFEKETDLIENRLTYNRIQIEKLSEQKKMLSKEIQHFRDEVKSMRLQNKYEKNQNSLI